MKKLLFISLCALLCVNSLNAFSWQAAKKYAKPAAKIILAGSGMYAGCAFYYLMAQAANKSAGNLYCAFKATDIIYGSTAIERGVDGIFYTAALGALSLGSFIAVGSIIALDVHETSNKFKVNNNALDSKQNCESEDMICLKN